MRTLHDTVFRCLHILTVLLPYVAFEQKINKSKKTAVQIIYTAGILVPVWVKLANTKIFTSFPCVGVFLRKAYSAPASQYEYSS